MFAQHQIPFPMLLYGLLFLLPFALVPLFCAWLYQRKKYINGWQCYGLNILLTALLPFTWNLFQDPVAVSNDIPLFSSASIFQLGNLVFGIPTGLINQLFMNFLLAPEAKPEPRTDTDGTA
jgi:hypothetical protein